jgi:hypothetical protein
MTFCDFLLSAENARCNGPQARALGLANKSGFQLTIAANREHSLFLELKDRPPW